MKKEIIKEVEKKQFNDLEKSENTLPSEKEVKEIKVIERIIENREIAPQDAFGKMSKSQIELVKRTVAKGASDDELRLFIQVCKGANLNPFLKQVFLVPRWDSREAKEVRAIQVSIDGFRAIAEESGGYAGNEDAVFTGEELIEYGKDKKQVKVPLEAKVTVYKLVEGQRYPFTATARWSEYYPGDKMGFQWHIRPYLMLGKCAEALALRKAFPKLLSGMYASEELDKGQIEVSPEEKAQRGMQTLIKLINTCSFAELEDYKKKITETIKYSEEQKKELLKAVEDRFNEIDKQTP
jgi:phage recombination protein Bet